MSERTISKIIFLAFLSFCLFPRLLFSAEQTEFLVRADLSGTRGGNLTVALSADPATFNRMLAAGLAGAIIADRLSGDLVHVNRVTFELEPSLATGWSVAKDNRTFTISLRRGLRFSDGSPCTADDVLFTFQVLQDPRTEAAMGDLLRIDGVFPTWTKIDEHTLRLTFPRQVGMGLRALDSIPILPRGHLLKAYQEGKLAGAWGPSVSPQEVVGMGPFRLQEYQRGGKVVIERNPYYWKKDKSGQALPYLDTIVFIIVPDRNAETLRFQAGELDLMNVLSAENYALLRRPQADGNITLRDLGPGLSHDFFWLNLNSGADRIANAHIDPEKQALFRRSELRLALSHALDREGMARSILLGLGVPQYGPISTGNKIWHNPAIPRADYNPPRAKELLAQIGLRDSDNDGILEYGSGHKPFEILLYTARGIAAREKTAQVIKENLARVGIRVEIQPVPVNELITRIVRSFDYEAVLFGFQQTDVVPDLLTDLWYSSGRNHFWFPAQAKPDTSWDSEIDALTSRLLVNMDPAVRKSACARIQEVWAREMPAIPTIAPNVLTAWRQRVENVRPSILAPQLLWNAEELAVKSR
jgi:peptide/nickel transport system substrate-binding protein